MIVLIFARRRLSAHSATTAQTPDAEAAVLTDVLPYCGENWLQKPTSMSGELLR
jgi:hypothetical protein